MGTREIQWAMFITGGAVCGALGSTLWGMFLFVVALCWSVRYDF